MLKIYFHFYYSDLPDHLASPVLVKQEAEEARHRGDRQTVNRVIQADQA